MPECYLLKVNRKTGSGDDDDDDDNDDDDIDDNENYDHVLRTLKYNNNNNKQKISNNFIDTLVAAPNAKHPSSWSDFRRSVLEILSKNQSSAVKDEGLQRA